MDFKVINGIKVFAASNREELISTAIEEKRILVAINAEKILHSTPGLKEVINSNIGYADGIGAVWALKKKGARDAVKVPGCELWLDIVAKYSESKSFYLVGATEEVIVETVLKLKGNFPLINILNFRNGFLRTEEEKDNLVKDILEKRPDIVFVAMGSPKQELLMAELHTFHMALYQGLGGSFDVYTGKVARAPDWWVRNNLEWAYRLTKQPSRINRQIHLFRFFLLLQFNRL